MRALALLLVALALAAWLVLRVPEERGPGAESRAALPAQLERDGASDVLDPLLVPAAPPVEDAAGAPEPRRELHVPGEPVSGRVDVAGGLPPAAEAVVIAHAHRAGVSRRDSLRLEASVASDGSFAFEVPRGTRSVTLDLESALLSLPDEVEVKPGRRDIVLRPLVFGIVRGRVHAPQLSPWSLASIDVRCGPSEYGHGTGLTRCDESGRFSIPWMSVGEPLELSATGAASNAVLALAPLAAGEVREVELVLEPWQGVRGIVLDEEGAPIEGADVDRARAIFAGDIPASGIFVSVSTTADGRFELPPMPHGSFRIVARAAGLNSVRHDLRMPEEAGEELRFVLARRGVVRGRVRGPDGAPVAGARVYSEAEAFGSNGVSRSRLGKVLVDWETAEALEKGAETDDEGRFELPIDSGPLRLRAQAEGFAPSTRFELTLGSGAEHDGVVLELRDACHLRGRVLDEHGEPLRIPLIFESADGVSVSILADENGKFQASALPPGSGKITPRALRHQDYLGSAEVELVPARETEVELRLQRAEGSPERER